MITDFYYICSQSSELQALLNDSNNDIKIFPILAPQGTGYPYIKYQTISVTTYSLLAHDDVADQVRVQVDIFAKKYSDTTSIAKEIRKTFKDLAKVEFRFEDFDNTALVYRYSLEIQFIQDVDFT
ncbi:DUF3168 domain-containing protein [Vreelandella titanicae]|uniref:DUF3168 domain-containing protein n=1 Tax=Vreelandella titanicae TaxID=664683 RepID=A0AAP9NMQ7_9GAMM|nr:DUF3168 domain-containing protein [Halomonas titanicae]QKS24596.1 hypothetical protein FX987_02378 [Halomonas titanicae]